MASISLKTIAQNCIGLSSNFSVIRDFFGYPFGTPQHEISLRRQMELAKGNALNFSIILVGTSDDPGQNLVSWADRVAVQHGIQIAREIYGQVDLGIRKVYWSHIDRDDAGGYTTIDSSSEGNDLTNDFYGANDGLDIFFCPNVDPADGWGPGSAGTCDKGDKDDWTGVVCQLGLGNDFTGVLLAHEVGHYLGLGTGPNATNFMGVDSNNDGIDEIGVNSTNVTTAQGNTMKNHCYVNPACA
jgi:hypothetical protein